MSLEERPCYACGEKTGGNLRRHKPDCSYVKLLCDKYPACKEYVESKQPYFERENKNHKHSFQKITK